MSEGIDGTVGKSREGIDERIVGKSREVHDRTDGKVSEAIGDWTTGTTREGHERTTWTSVGTQDGMAGKASEGIDHR